MQENTQRQQLSVKLENETLNNKKLLRELNKANQTISQLRKHLEKSTSRVVDQAKSAKYKKKLASEALTKVESQDHAIYELNKKLAREKEKNKSLRKQQDYHIE